MIPHGPPNGRLQLSALVIAEAAGSLWSSAALLILRRS